MWNGIVHPRVINTIYYSKKYVLSNSDRILIILLALVPIVNCCEKRSEKVRHLRKRDKR